MIVIFTKLLRAEKDAMHIMLVDAKAPCSWQGLCHLKHCVLLRLGPPMELCMWRVLRLPGKVLQHAQMIFAMK